MSKKTKKKNPIFWSISEIAQSIDHITHDDLYGVTFYWTHQSRMANSNIRYFSEALRRAVKNTEEHKQMLRDKIRYNITQRDKADSMLGGLSMLSDGELTNVKY